MTEFFALVPQGADLLDCLRKALADRRIASGIVGLSGGTLERLSYHPASQKPALTVRGAITLLCANLAFNIGLDGVALLDCYAAFVDESGVSYGGRLAQEPCIVGEGGVYAWISAFHDPRVRQHFATHTSYPQLLPLDERSLR